MNFIEVFIQHLLFDKHFAREFAYRFLNKANSLGEYISRKWKEELFLRKGRKDVEEFIDFIDGNGFIVDRNSDPNYISILIIYKEPKNEKRKSLNRMVTHVSEEILSYSSMETVPRFALEYQKLRASWSFWLRVCRRMELLRLVPEGRCGSASVPRPP